MRTALRQAIHDVGHNRPEAGREERKANMVVENSPVVHSLQAAGLAGRTGVENVVQFGYTPEEFLSGELATLPSSTPGHGKLIADTESSPR
jgi:hypothetical protein